MSHFDPSHEADRYINDQMNQAEDACFSCAVANGHSIEEAQACDDGDVGCPNCPFRTDRKKSPGDHS